MLCLRLLLAALQCALAFRSPARSTHAEKSAGEGSRAVGSGRDEYFDADDDEEKQAAVGKWGLGVRRSHFADGVTSPPPRPFGIAEKRRKKRVLMVIDVQDGYDAEFVKTVDGPGGLAHIVALQPVNASYELGGRGPEPKKVIQVFEPGSEPKITYDKGWNRGVPDAGFSAVAMRAVAEIKSGTYDLVVFTADYLERASTGSHEIGIFPLDDTPWSDQTKPIALVGYGQYLTFASRGPGADISSRIRDHLSDVTNVNGEDDGTANGMPALFFRKQVDDAFDDEVEVSARTNNEPWLDDVDVDDDALPQRGAETLVDKLSSRGFGPEDAVLSFVGVVTNRCVAKTLVHAVDHGYQTRVLMGGCAAMTPADHAYGMDMMREKGGDMVEFID